MSNAYIIVFEIRMHIVNTCNRTTETEELAHTLWMGLRQW